jgi:hypothetical protein
VNNEEAIANFRKAFINLPEEYRKREVNRLYNIVNEIPFIIFEDADRGKVLKFLEVKDLMEYLWREKQIKTTSSYIHRVLKGQHPLLHGYRVYKQLEEV